MESVSDRVAGVRAPIGREEVSTVNVGQSDRVAGVEPLSGVEWFKLDNFLEWVLGIAIALSKSMYGYTRFLNGIGQRSPSLGAITSSKSR